MADAQEVRLRRWAKRLGLVLRKSRAKRFHVDDRGAYSVVTLDNVLVSGGSCELDLDGVENVLADYELKLRSQPPLPPSRRS